MHEAHKTQIYMILAHLKFSGGPREDSKMNPGEEQANLCSSI